MSLNRMPVFVWAQLVTSFMVVFAMPAVMAASSFLIMDRLVGTHFFNPAEGGDALLWQHLFWFFGHPEVYIIFIPATRDRFGDRFRLSRAGRFSATRLSCCRWWRRAFSASGCGCTTCSRPASPSSAPASSPAASMMIAIPSGVQIFCWIATLWDGRPAMRTPLLFVLGFYRHLRARRVDRRDAGLGAARPAGARHVLRRRAFSLCAARRRRLPALRRVLLLVPESDRPDAERDGPGNGSSGCFSSASTSRSSRCTSSGCSGMPRRVYTYPAGLGWDTLNLIASLGAVADRRERHRFPRQCRGQPAPRRDCRRQSVGRVLARMGHLLAAAALQFRRDPVRHRARSAVGRARRAAGRDRIAQRQARGPDHRISATPRRTTGWDFRTRRSGRCLPRSR